MRFQEDLCISEVTNDANGNTLSDPSGKSFTWDFGDRLTQAVVPGTNGGTTSFRYDPFGRRIQKSGPLGTTNYLYDGKGLIANAIEEVDNSGNVLARYTQGTDVDEQLALLRSSTLSFYQRDGVGSATSLSSMAGALGNTYTYDAFGKLTASSGSLVNPFQFSGREFDSETGLFYDRARYYDPSAGRFLSEDPVGFEAGVDFYPYVRNNPVLLNDPSGQNPGVAVALAPVAGGGISGWMLSGSSAGPIGALVGLNVGLLINDSIGVYDLGVASGWWGQPKPQPQPNSCSKEKKKECDDRYNREKTFCNEEYGNYPNLLRKCRERAMWRWNNCLRGLPDPGPLDPLDPTWSPD